MIRVVFPVLVCAVLTCLTACGGGESSAPPPESTATVPGACEDAYADIAKYYESSPDLRRPARLDAATFIKTCRELPGPAQRCMLFSYMQAHSAACEDAMNRAPPELRSRLAALVGK